MKTYNLKKGIAMLSVFATLLCYSCKDKENTDNDAANKAPGSFEENHTVITDTSGTATDSVTSNSTQTDPAAN